MGSEDKTLPQIPQLPDNVPVEGTELLYIVKNGADWRVELSRLINEFIFNHIGEPGMLVKFSDTGTLVESIIEEVSTPYPRLLIAGGLIIDGEIYATGNVVSYAQGGPGDAPTDPLSLHAATIASADILGHVKLGVQFSIDENGVMSLADTFITSINFTSALANKADLVNGVVPANQLPSYVDDVIEYATFTSFPVTGESGKIYVAIDTLLAYRWSGTQYSVISPSLALGETSSTAYRGDRGKTAYDHSQVTHNAALVGLGNVTNESKTTMFTNPVITGSATAEEFKIKDSAGNVKWTLKLSGDELEFFNKDGARRARLKSTGKMQFTDDIEVFSTYS